MRCVQIEMRRFHPHIERQRDWKGQPIWN